MQNLLPIPTLQFFPKALQDSTEIQALASFLDTEFMAWFAETKGIETLKDPARTPSVCMEEMGYWLSAGIASGDSDRIKRAKISQAIENQKLRGTWKYSIKPIIDNYAGGDSSIISVQGVDDFMLTGDSNDPVGYLWSLLGGLDDSVGYGILLAGGGGSITFVTDLIGKENDQMLIIGTDGTETEYSFAIGGEDVGVGYGSRILGDGTEFGTGSADYIEPFIKGNVLIDVDNPAMSANALALLVTSLMDVVPAYFRIYLGYVVSGSFIAYTNGVIG
jgi:hypothetical protein